MSDSVRPHRWQPTRLPRPWDSPGKNTGVGCHFLLQCMRVKSESEVAQSCPTLWDPMDCSLPGSSVHGIFQARILEWGATAFSDVLCYFVVNQLSAYVKVYFWALSSVPLICVSFSANSMLFWLLWLCSVIWNQGMWYLQPCCSFSRLLWLLGIFCYKFLGCPISVKNGIGILVEIFIDSISRLLWLV